MFASIVTDLGFGDAGKGTTVDFLTRQTYRPVIVRFNGGAQAAHNVHTDDGRHHTFSQFGSGTLVSGTETVLSRFVLFDPYALRSEAKGLESLGVVSPLSLVMVDAAALTVTPFQKAANRIREVLRGDGRHGSVGMGIGETMADMLAFPTQAVYAGDLRDPMRLTAKLTAQQELKYTEFRDSLEWLAATGNVREELRLITDPAAPRMVASTMNVLLREVRLITTTTLKRLALTRPLIFEGAQGILIDEWHGFHPYTTWSTTTADNANTLLREIDYQGPVTRYGVVRAYSTRHGPGPFPTEDRGLTAVLPDTHNVFGRWQGGFRVGWLDVPLTRYALTVSGGVDNLVLTHLDRFDGVPKKRVVSAYTLPADALTISERSAVVSTERQPDPGLLHVASFKQKTDLEDLTYQEMLASLVMRARPVVEYTDLAGEAYADFLESRLGVPVAITSYGKTAAMKRSRQRFALAS